MNQGLHQQIQKVGDNVTTIQESLDSLKADVVKLGSRTSKAKARISLLEDENACRPVTKYGEQNHTATVSPQIPGKLQQTK